MLNRRQSTTVAVWVSGVTLLSVIFGSPALADYFYRVKPGETLSQILHDLNLKPIYGKRGTLQETLAHNQKLSENQIYPAQKVYLPVEKNWVAPTGFEIKSNQEVVRLDRVIAQFSPESQVEPEAVSAVSAQEKQDEEALIADCVPD